MTGGLSNKVFNEYEMNSEHSSVPFGNEELI